MRNFVHRGDAVPVTAAAAVSSGDGVLIGSLFGVALTDAAIGEAVELQTVGVIDLAKASGAWSAGIAVFFDATAGVATDDDDTGGNLRIGVATQEAGSSDATGRVKLLGQAV